MVLIYSDLDNRRFFKWGDFLIENGEFEFNKEEMEYIKTQTDKGNKCQKILEKDIASFQTYRDYIKTMLFYISLQDDIIQNIVDFQKGIIKYRSELKTKKPCKYFRWKTF